jgi:hypothetical protein
MDSILKLRKETHKGVGENRIKYAEELVYEFLEKIN